MKLRLMYIEYLRKITQKQEINKKDIPDLKFQNISIEEITTKKKIDLLSQIHKMLGNEFSTPAIEYFVNIIDFYFQDNDFKQILMNMCIAAAAIFMRQAFLYGCLLFDIIVSLHHYFN
jgi:hypothetical protein